MDVTIGALRMTVDDATRATFNASRVTAEVTTSPTVLGRSPDVDLMLVDVRGRISRVHLHFERRVFGWTVADLGSKHGTWLWHAGIRTGGLRAVPGHRYRLAEGMSIELAQSVGLRVSIERFELAGQPTATDDDAGNEGSLFPEPALQPFALALTAHLRSTDLQTSGRRSPPSVMTLAETFGVSRPTIYAWTRKLAEAQTVRRFLTDPGWTGKTLPKNAFDDLAEALVAAFSETFGEPPIDFSGQA